MDSTTIIILIATIIAAWYACYRAYKNKQSIEDINNRLKACGEALKGIGKVVDDHAEVINQHSDAIKTIAVTNANVIEHQAKFNKRVEKQMKKKPTQKI